MNPGTISVKFDGYSIKAEPFHCWPPRGENIVEMINMAFAWISPKGREKMKPFSVVFDINDWGDGKYSIASDKYNEKAIPCFSFIHWKQGNIEDYSKVCESIAKASKKKYIYEKAFWIGFLSHPTRKVLFDKYKSHNKISVNEFNIMWGSKHSDNPIINNPELLKSNYVSLPDHCKYKYLIDMQGMGYSARTKFLMHSQRPILYQDRKLHEYWYWQTKPFIHYIPIKEDLSNLEQMIDWADHHPNECEMIAKSAYNFARNHLRKEDAISRMKNIIYKLGTGEYK